MWVLGLVDTSFTPALGYMEMVQRHDAAMLLPIIQVHTKTGTIIHSDEWAAYNRVQSLPTISLHQTVNHSVEFVNSTTGTHTQNVESYWNQSKTNIRRKYTKHMDFHQGSDKLNNLQCYVQCGCVVWFLAYQSATLLFQPGSDHGLFSAELHLLYRPRNRKGLVLLLNF